MFGTIVAATDGSGPATRAVDLAARIAGATGSTLVAISVYHEPDSGNPLAPPRGPGIDAAQGVLEDVARHHGASITVQTEAVAGDPAEQILEAAKRHRAGLIVTGDRGMSGAKAVLGSVPNTISHHAPCDLLLAHTADQRVDEVPLAKMLLATDGSKTALKAVEAGAKLAEALGIKAVLVTVADPDEGTRILDETARTLGRSFETRCVQGSVADQLLEVAQTEGVDLIVTGSRGMQGARRLLGSVPNSVSHHLGCSMLIVKTT